MNKERNQTLFGGSRSVNPACLWILRVAETFYALQLLEGRRLDGERRSRTWREITSMDPNYPARLLRFAVSFPDNFC